MLRIYSLYTIALCCFFFLSNTAQAQIDLGKLKRLKNSLSKTPVYFTTEKTSSLEEAQAKHQKEFEVGTPIYVTYQLHGKLTKVHRSKDVGLDLLINDQKIENYDLDQHRRLNTYAVMDMANSPYADKEYIQFVLVPSETDAVEKGNETPVWITKVFSKLDQGKHKITIGSIFDSCPDCPVSVNHRKTISGDFDLIITEKGKKQAQALYESRIRQEIMANYKKEDEGMTSKAHEKNAGKIVFSNQPVLRGKEDESQFIDKYSLGDNLYCRVYFKESIYNSVLSMTAIDAAESTDIGVEHIKVYLNEQLVFDKVREYNEYDDEDLTELTTKRDVLVHPSESGGEYNYIFQSVFMDNESKLTNGSHKLRIEVYVHDRDSKTTGHIIAAGNLDIDIADGGLAKVYAHPRFQMPDVKPSTGEKGQLEQFFLDMVRKDSGPDFAYPSLYIRSDWELVRHPISGVILHRELIALLTIKDLKKENCSYQRIIIKQPFDGNNFMNSYSYDGGLNLPRSIPCMNIK